jgi:predicted HTH transcriptional regulator
VLVKVVENEFRVWNSLADIKRGTGISKIYEEMAHNGSPDPQFLFDDARSYFQVMLPAHPEYKPSSK